MANMQFPNNSSNEGNSAIGKPLPYISSECQSDLPEFVNASVQKDFPENLDIDTQTDKPKTSKTQTFAPDLRHKRLQTMDIDTQDAFAQVSNTVSTKSMSTSTEKLAIQDKMVATEPPISRHTEIIMQI